MQVWRNASSTVMLQPGLAELGMVAGNGWFGVISSASAHLELGRNVWVCLCQKRKAAITDKESPETHPSASSHEAGCLLSDEKTTPPKTNHQTKNPKETIFERTRHSSSAGKCNAQWPNAQVKESAGKEMSNLCFPSFLWEIGAVKACYDCAYSHVYTENGEVIIEN